MSSLSIDVKPFRINTQSGITCASLIEMVVKGRKCVVLKDESEDGHYAPIGECLIDVLSNVNPCGDKIVAIKDSDSNWYEITTTKHKLVRKQRVHGAVSNCCALEIPYLILIEEALA